MTDKSQFRRLNQDDVKRLMSDPSPQTRADTSAKIAAQFEAQELSDNERQIAEDIFRALIKDVEVRVRESLSAHLKNSSDLPRDVALALAKDVDSVALPMLKFSEVLTDEDLIEIVRDQGEAKKVAIAQRKYVSSKVADALIDTGNENTVARLVANEGADLTKKAFNRVMSEYEKSVAVSDSLARRPNMPASVSEHLIEVLTERLQDYLISKHELPFETAANLILQARERATMSLVDYGSTDSELENLIEQLFRKGRLTPSLLLRGLCLGGMPFFERAMARLAELPLQNVRILIHDQGSLGLESFYIRANLPQRQFPVFRAGIDLVDETDYDGGLNDRQRFVEKMLERILTQFEDPSSRMAEEDIEYLMGKLEQVAA